MISTPSAAISRVAVSATAAPVAIHLVLMSDVSRFLSPLPSSAPALVLVDDAGLHHEGDAFELRDVAQRIAADGDDVGELAGLDRPDPVGPAHDLGGRARRRHDRGDRLLAEAD